MNILVILPGTFIGPSSMHVFHLVNEICKKPGIKCMVAVTSSPETVEQYGTPLFDIINVSATPFSQWPIRIQDLDLIYAWTPREFNRKTTKNILAHKKIPYIVHLEDNEERILADFYNCSIAELEGKIPESMETKSGLSHPIRYKTFLKGAAGITTIYESLQEFAPKEVPVTTFWAACEEEFFNLPPTPNQEIRTNLHIDPAEIVLAYPGNIHHSNSQEVYTYFSAVALLRQQGYPLRIIRCGNPLPFEPTDGLLDFEFVPTKQIASLISCADILVQPGAPNEFNNFRLPCKIPMFLASARPVILPYANIGLHLAHKENCYHLHAGTLEETADAIKYFIDNPDQRILVGLKGRKFAQKNFSWKSNATKVVQFIKKMLPH